MNKIEEFKTQLNDTLDSWVVQGKELNFKECIIEEIIDNLKSIIQQTVSEQKEKDADDLKKIIYKELKKTFSTVTSMIKAEQAKERFLKATREQ